MSFEKGYNQRIKERILDLKERIEANELILNNLLERISSWINDGTSKLVLSRTYGAISYENEVNKTLLRKLLSKVIICS